MIKIEKTNVFGLEAAIRGMRNPMNSWNKSDSGYKPVAMLHSDDIEIKYVVGKKDLELMKKLSNAGNDHGKFMRMINVTCDITAPLYFLKEFDTYKIGTVANSCSTMHRIQAKEFTLEDFSCEHLTHTSLEELRNTIDLLNMYREAFLNYPNYSIIGKEWQLFSEQVTKKDIWWQMIQLLPSSYNQKRTIQLNYAVLKNIYHSRKNHKLDEWHDFCHWVERLPYSELITGDDNE